MEYDSPPARSRESQSRRYAFPFVDNLYEGSEMPFAGITRFVKYSRFGDFQRTLRHDRFTFNDEIL